MKENEIKFSFSNAVPVKYALEHFSELSFPSLKTRIINNRINKPLMAVMAKKENEIVGLILASRQNKSSSEILTLLVKPEYRLQGIGMKLIKHINQLQRDNGFELSRIFYFKHWKNNAFLVKLWEKHLWSSPTTMLYRFEHHYRKTKQILPSGLQVPEEYSFVSWNKMDRDAKNEHIEAIDKRDDIRKMFRISNYGSRIVPELTHMMIKEDEIIGWCIALKANADSIEHTLFILPEHRTSPLLPIALITKNWLVQMKSNFSKAVWLIDAKNGSMLRFMKKKLPHLVHVETSLNFISKEIADR